MTGVASYELLMDPADWRWLRQHAGTYRCFPCELRTGHDAHSGWIGYRGRYSRWFRKPSFDLWFEEENLLDGQGKLILNAAYRDPSMLRAPLAMRAFSDFGVPAPRIWHVWLTMNQEALGLYQAVESIDVGWLRRKGIAEGCIYYAVGTEGTLGLTRMDNGRLKRSLVMGYEKCYPWNDDFSELATLIRQVNRPGDANFEAEIDRVVDVETFLRWLVAVDFVSHTDGFVQNYALVRPSGGRWQISPWDCDGTWGRIPNGRIWAADDLPVAKGDDNRLAIRLLGSRRWRRRYIELSEEAQGSVLTRAHLVPILESIYQEIRPYVLMDAKKPRSESTFRREPRRIRQYISERTAVVRRRLALLKTTVT